MSVKRIYLLLLIVTVIFVGWWLSSKITATQVEKRHAPENRILNNPFAALQLLLNQYEIKSEVFFGRDILDSLPATDHTLVVTDVHQPLLSEQQQDLLDWTYQGGHLVYEVTYSSVFNFSSDFSHQLGFNVVSNTQPEQIEKEWRHAEFIVDGESGYIDLDWRHTITHAEADTSTDTKTSTGSNETARVIARSEAGIVVYQLKYGEGLVTLLTDSSFMITPQVWSIEQTEEDKLLPRIGVNSHDNALFSYQLFKDESVIWFIRDNGSISLLSLTARHFPQTTLFTCAWLLLFFISLLKRQGPQIQYEDTDQQNLKQHLIQTGRFHWANDKAVYLLNSWRQRVIRRLTQRQPQLAGTSIEDMAVVLEQQTDFNQQQIAQAMSHHARNQTEFVHYIRILRALWKL